MISSDQTLKEVPPATISGDRRAQPRFSIRLPMEHTVVGKGDGGQRGTGVVVDISSTGMGFHTSGELQCGSFVHVSISLFSGSSNGVTTLKAYGRVVRNSEQATAIRVLRYDFSRQESTPSPLDLNVY